MRALLLFLPLTAFAQVKVVTSTTDLAAVAAEVGGDAVTVTALAKATEDPHYVDARPSFLVPLSQADLFIQNGLELEVGWLPPLLVNARNAKIQPGGAGFLDASSAIQPLGAVAKVDRAHGDIHGQGNPHYMVSPVQGAQVALAIGERLAAVDPTRADHYRQRAKALSDRLNATAQTWAKRFAELPASKRKLVTYHRSWPFLLALLDLTAPIEIEPRPGIPPTPAHTAKVAQTMKREGIKVVLQEAYYPRKTSETVARIAGGHLLTVVSQTEFGKQTYEAHIEALLKAVHDALAR